MCNYVKLVARNQLVIWVPAIAHIIHFLIPRLNYKAISRIVTLSIWMMGFSMLPGAYASQVESPFPDIPFKAFSQFITQNFSSKISLSTVMVILFSLTENPDLLSLHARQQYTRCQGENSTHASGWIKGLARALKGQVDENQKRPLKMKNVEKGLNEEQEITALGVKLDSLAKLLKLHPYDSNGQFLGQLQPISHKLIQPVHVICPNTLECQIVGCNLRSLRQISPTRDIPLVTLIKNSTIYEDVPVLTGQCPNCKTKYSADHERAIEDQQEKKFSRLYLNSAKYLKVGQTLWVDRSFSQAVLNGIYSFHASAAAYGEYWNNSFGNNQLVKQKRISRRHVWQAFVQESIRSIASLSGIDLELQDGLAIDEVTKEAFAVLGANGIIRVAAGHQCSECAHEYKATADVISNSDPSATVGVDSNENISHLPSQQGQSSSSNGDTSDDNSEDMQVDKALVTLMVVDGLVTGPSVWS